MLPRPPGARRSVRRRSPSMCGFTSDFDRVSAGYSPDRVDALVWALTDLLVEPMSNYGIFEYTRQKAAEITGQASRKQPVEQTWAIGSIEWQRQQQENKE